MQLDEFPNLTFVENESYEFIVNRKYIRVCNHDSIHIVIYREEPRKCEHANDMNLIYISFSLYKEIRHGNDSSNCIYYEVVSKKQQIQDAMELRALNLIIRNIIGDKYYEWK